LHLFLLLVLVFFLFIVFTRAIVRSGSETDMSRLV
jgi:hypothetical protein